MNETLEDTVKITTPTDREIRFEREFDAPLDKVWRALSEPELVAQWWGRGRPMTVERMEFQRGGYWRYVMPGSKGESQAFGGRYREIVPMQRIVNTFEWDGMPGHVGIDTTVLTDLGGGRTRLVVTSLFHTTEERDGIMSTGMEEGAAESYVALDRLLASLA